MKKITLSILVLVFFQTAFANSGSVPYINVLGISPEGHSAGAKISVTGAKEFYNFLPSPGEIEEPYHRGLVLVSGSWVLSMGCDTPLNDGVTRYTCTFSLYEKSKYGDPGSESFGSDTYQVKSSDFGWLSTSFITALGIDTVNIPYPRGKEIFSFYGKGAGIFAKKILEASKREPNKWADVILVGDTASGSLTFNCQKNYIRLPGTPQQQARSDYKCSIGWY